MPARSRLIIVGGGGFGREAIDIAIASSAAGGRRFVAHELLGVLDDHPTPMLVGELQRREVNLLGDVELLATASDHRGLPQDCEYVVAIGDPVQRASVVKRLEHAPFRAAVLVHPTAIIGSNVDLAPGVVISAGANLSTNIAVDRHAHINAGAIVGHDTTIGEYAAISPGSVISGHCRVGRGVLVGAGAVLLEAVEAGAWATVGAAACVVRDVSPGAVVKGVPAK